MIISADFNLRNTDSHHDIFHRGKIKNSNNNNNKTMTEHNLTASLHKKIKTTRNEVNSSI